MFNRKSSYALNKKDPNAIVYMDANEAIIRLTREDFASEEEFLKWKSLSDADYHASEKEDHVYANHMVQSIRVRGKKELDITFTHEDEYKKALQLLALAAQQKDYEQRKVG